MPYARPHSVAAGAQAQVDTPIGFVPYGEVLRIGTYLKDASAAAIYPGDAVILEADGGVAPAAASSVNIIGVAAEYSPASTEKTDFPVYDHPNQYYYVQDDSDTTQMAETEVGTNVDMIVTTGNTTTLRSQHEIDSSSAAVTATLACKVIRLHPIENRQFATAAGQQRLWVVKFNSHLHSAEVAGI